MSKRISWNRFSGKLPANAKKVDRSTRYGNPYKLSEYTRGESLKLYEKYIENKLEKEPDFLKALVGKNLACSCSLSENCHADILLTKIKSLYP